MWSSGLRPRLRLVRDVVPKSTAPLIVLLSLHELVKPGVNGVVFDTAQQLADHLEVRGGADPSNSFPIHMLTRSIL